MTINYLSLSHYDDLKLQRIYILNQLACTASLCSSYR